MSCGTKQCTVMLTEFKDEDFRRKRPSNFEVYHDESGIRVWFVNVLDKAEELIKEEMENQTEPQPVDVCEGEDCYCSIVSKEWGDWEEIFVDPPVEFTVNGVKYTATTTMKRRTGTGKGWCRTRNLKVAFSKTYLEGNLASVTVECEKPLTKEETAFLVKMTGAKLG